MTTLEICGAFGGNSRGLWLKVPPMRILQKYKSFFASESSIGSRNSLDVDWIGEVLVEEEEDLCEDFISCPPTFESDIVHD